MMSTDAYTIMIMMMIMPCMILEGLLYLRMSNYNQLARLWWAQGVYEPPHSHLWAVYREVLHIQFVWSRGYLYNGFEWSVHNHELHVFTFSYPNSGVTYGVFLKILTQAVCYFYFSGKGKTPG